MAEEEIGKISDFYAHPVVAGIELTASLKVGDKIRIKGHTTDFYQKIQSMQVEHSSVDTVKLGESAGMKVESPVREHDLVFKVKED